MRPVALVARQGGAAALVWLVGIDGNTNPRDDAEADGLRRMVARASTPVGIPAADRSG